MRNGTKRVLQVGHLARIWLAVENELRHIRILVRLLLLLPMRREELTGLEWKGVRALKANDNVLVLDPTAYTGPRLDIPAHRMKGGKRPRRPSLLGRLAKAQPGFGEVGAGLALAGALTLPQPVPRTARAGRVLASRAVDAAADAGAARLQRSPCSRTGTASIVASSTAPRRRPPDAEADAFGKGMHSGAAPPPAIPERV